MNFQEAVEIIVNYVEVLEPGYQKTHFSEIINADFVLSEDDLHFFNQLIEDDSMPLNIRDAIQVIMIELR